MNIKDFFICPKRPLVKIYMLLGPKMVRVKKRKTRKVEEVYLYYRICDHGYPKEKPKYITKENCLKNAVARFPLNKVHWIVYADNVCEETYQMICKYVPENQVRRVRIGHGAGTFRLVYEDAIKKNPDDLIYFLEDDYIHSEGAFEALIDAAECNYTDYFTLYDHPAMYDYCAQQNPFNVFGGEKSVVYWCKTHHWKQTNSTTMTLAAYVDTLQKDKNVFWRWTETRHPYDFHIFMDFRIFTRRKLSCPIPSFSTHGEYEWLAPGKDWENERL